MWVWQIDAQDFVKFQLSIGCNTTVVDWKSFARDVAANYYMNHSQKIGGEGVEVEIDECLLVRRKYNRGRLVRDQWVFGGREVDTLKCFVIPVENRTHNTLIREICNNILPGSIITSDCWAAYGDLSEYGYTHLTVNHSQNFVDPITHATTNHVENMWQKLKTPHKLRYGTHRSTLCSHLIEFMWRVEFKKSFGAFFDHIRENYLV